MIGQLYQQNLLANANVFANSDLKDQNIAGDSILDIESPKPAPSRIQPGTIIESNVFFCDRISLFYFKDRFIDHDLIRKMHMVTEAKYQTGALMYSARPYTTNLGDMKLYLDNRRLIFRCLIKDLHPENDNGVLKMKATIEIVDKRLALRGIDLDKIYDIPNLIEHIKDYESELKAARLHFGQPPDYQDKEVDSFFHNCIKSSQLRTFKIKILDDKDGVYHVDILSKGESLLKYMRERFLHKLSNFKTETIEPCKFETKQNGFINFTPTNRYKKATVDTTLSKIIRQQQNLTYDGALDYFRKKLHQIRISSSKSHVEQRFFSVKVISWSDPDSFYIIPSDRDYLLTHQKFIIEQERSSQFTKAFVNPGKLIVPYELGQKCYFLNTEDMKLGKWLRGIIVEVPAYDESGHMLSSGLNKETHEIDSDKENSIWSSSKDHPDLVVYKVQSVDYGFICISSAINLRQVPDEKEFDQRGPWALRCKLFGLDPQSHVPGAEMRVFSPTCLALVDSWMRERILDDGRYSGFYMLFRTNLDKIANPMPWPKPCAEISLFHYQDPPYDPDNCLKTSAKRIPRYDCLNYFMVQRGVASDYIINLDKRSNLDLEEFSINMLAAQSLIPAPNSQPPKYARVV